MFTVVQDQQQFAVRQVLGEKPDRRQPCGGGQTQRREDGVPDQGVVGERRELDMPHAVGVDAPKVAAHADGQPGLAGATHPGERHQPGGGQPLPHGRHLCAPADETGHLGR